MLVPKRRRRLPADERRAFRRFRINHLNVHYMLTDDKVRFPSDASNLLDGLSREVGNGRTINISAGGVLLTTETTFVKGRSILLSIDWPFSRDDHTLKLLVLGTVVRSGPHR